MKTISEAELLKNEARKASTHEVYSWEHLEEYMDRAFKAGEAQALENYYLVDKTQVAKYQKKYNQTPLRKARERHRHHVRVGKIFDNCSICQVESNK